MESAGITDKVVLTRLREALDYTKVTRIKTGEIVNEYVDVDNDARLRAVEFAAKLKGWRCAN